MFSLKSFQFHHLLNQQLLWQYFGLYLFLSLYRTISKILNTILNNLWLFGEYSSTVWGGKCSKGIQCLTLNNGDGETARNCINRCIGKYIDYVGSSGIEESTGSMRPALQTGLSAVIRDCWLCPCDGGTTGTQRDGLGHVIGWCTDWWGGVNWNMWQKLNIWQCLSL